MTQLGTISTAADGRYEFQITRRFPQPIDEVWDAITDPERIARWIAPTTYEPKAGSPLVIDFGDGNTSSGEVTTFDPPHVFEYTSRVDARGGPHGLIRFELREEGDTTVFVLTHTRQSAFDVQRTAPGWHACVDVLGAYLTGEPYDVEAIQAGVIALYVEATKDLT